MLLSLSDVISSPQPDPLTETLDSLVERAPAEGEESILTEMPELGDVIGLLKAAPGVDEVRLARRFRGTAFAPSFQVRACFRETPTFEALDCWVEITAEV